jgi:hypothetical protein
MCSPEIMANVYDGVTRRRFLGRLGAAGAASYARRSPQLAHLLKKP